MKISLRRRHTLMVEYGVFSPKRDNFTFFSGDSKSQRASKLHYWFKSYGDFAEWVNFANWWRCIGKGLRLQPAQQAFFLSNGVRGFGNPIHSYQLGYELVFCLGTTLTKQSALHLHESCWNSKRLTPCTEINWVLGRLNLQGFWTGKSQAKLGEMMSPHRPQLNTSWTTSQ